MYLGQIISIVLVSLILLGFLSYYVVIVSKKLYLVETNGNVEVEDTTTTNDKKLTKKEILKFSAFYFIGKIKEIFNKLMSSKLKALYIFLGLFLISYISYCFFALSLPTYEGNLYQPGLTTTEVSALASEARSVVNNWNVDFILIFYFILILLVVLTFFILLFKKKLTFGNTLVLIILLGIFVRLAYASYNDAIFTHQYDVWSTSYTGHYGITMHIYETFSPPDLIIRNGVPSLDNSYQFYQPKFVHYVFASLMHVNKYLIGTENTFTLYQSLRIYTCVVSLSIMVIGYYILKELLNNTKSIGFMVGVLFIIAAPFLIRVTSMTNNDGFLWLFVFLSVYASIKWYKNVSLKYSILLAISIGLAMSSKLSGAVIAIPIGLMMLYKLVVLIRQKEFKTILLNYVVFALLVFPIGLFWPMYNYYTQDQPFTYVWSNLNTNLLLDEGVTFYDRFVAFPIGQYFKYIFMMLWPSSIPKDYNIYTSIMKSSIFGEFTDYVGIGLVFGGTLWVVNFILMMMLVLGSAYLVIRAIIKKKYVSAFYLTSTLIIFYTSLLYFYNNETLMLVIFLNLIWIVSGIVIGIKYKWFNEGSFAPIFMLLIFITMMISYVGFNVANPYTCTLDFRYIALIYIPLGFLLVKLIDTLREEKSKVFKVISYVVIVTASIYSLSSICFYTTIG